MRMNTDQIREFAKFAHYVSTVLPHVVREKKIMDAIKNHSGTKEAIIKTGLMWGTGPLVNVNALVPQQRGEVWTDPTGGYRDHSNRIEVSLSHVGHYQTGEDMRPTRNGHVHLITVILLHELTHWAREKSGTNCSPGVEDGEEFEKEAYGKVFER